MSEKEFRACPVTGLKVHLSAQKLILANLVIAIISISIGGLAALMIAFSKSSISSLILTSHDTFYLWLTAHGLNMLIFWILWFEIPLLYFISTVLLNAPIFRASLGWLAFAFMFIGWLIVEITVFTGNASVLFTAYPPLAAIPIFYIGYLLFAIGAGLGVITFFLTLYRAKLEGTYKGHLPLVTWGGAIAAIIALTVVISGAFALIYTYLWRIGFLETINVMIYRWWFWGAGHSAQYINVTAMVAVWYALLALGTGFAAAKFVNERYARIAFALYILFVIPGIGHHILVDPGFSTIFKQASGSVGSHFLSIPSMLHALALLGGIEATLRATGHTSLLGWLRKIPWKNPGVSGLLFSMLLFGIGGIIAQPQTTLQPNLNYHNTLWVPSHFHFTVVGGTTLAFMALSYYVLPLISLRKLYSIKIAIAQVYLFFIGTLILGFSFSLLGWLGMPRRTFIEPNLMRSEWIGPAAIIPLGATILIISGLMFVLNILLTLLAGKKTTNPAELTRGLITAFNIKGGSNPSKKGALVIVIILLVIILLSLYFGSFIRLLGMPVIN